MTQIWPFPPLAEITETLEWQTDVIETINSEQRIALRDLPRRSFEMRHILSDEEYAAARAYLRETDSLYVPDWTQGVHLGPLVAGSDSDSINIPDNYFGFDVGDSVILRQSNALFELATIVEVDSNNLRILDNIDRAYDNARIYPVLDCQAAGGLSASRLGRRKTELSITVTSFTGEDLQGAHYSQYRSLYVVSECPVIAGGLRESFDWDFETFDAGFGTPYLYRKRAAPNVRYTMSWFVKTRLDRYRLRQFLYRCKGRHKAFWLSSRGKDLTPTVAIGSSDTSITVENYPGLVALGRTSNFDIDITTTSDVSYYRQVTSQSSGPSGTQVLNIDSSLGVNLGLSDIKRISFLRCSRLDVDSVQLQHIANLGVRAIVLIKEIGVPS